MVWCEPTCGVSFFVWGRRTLTGGDVVPKLEGC